MTALSTDLLPAEGHPLDELLRYDRIPHIWCSGCGLGASMACYERAIRASGIDEDKHVCVSGIGCSGRVAGYVRIDSYHTTHGRAIPFATGLHLAQPDLEVTVFSGDGDLTTIGGNHLIHAFRRNLNLNVFCMNNFTYGMTGGQFGATTPHGAISSTSPYGNFETPFNLPLMADSLGASFVARWTSLHVRQLENAMEQAMKVDGLAFIEVLSPCPPGFGKFNKYRRAIDEMRAFRERCEVDHDAPLAELSVDLTADKPIVLGNFVHHDRPSYLDQVAAAQPRIDAHA